MRGTEILGKIDSMVPNDPLMQLEQWRKDESILVEIGKELFEQPTRINARIPQHLAAKALAAWQRNDEHTDAGQSETELPRDRLSRVRAGTLALIGLSIETGPIVQSDGYVSFAINA